MSLWMVCCDSWQTLEVDGVIKKKKRAKNHYRLSKQIIALHSAVAVLRICFFVAVFLFVGLLVLFACLFSVLHSSICYHRAHPGY